MTDRKMECSASRERRKRGLVHVDCAAGHSEAAENIKQYLESAKLRFSATTKRDDYYVRMTAFRGMSFIEFRGGRVDAEWARDHRSRDRAALLIVLGGGVVIDGNQVSAGEFALIKPGESRLAAATTGARNDIIIVSFGAHKLAGLPGLAAGERCVVADFGDRNLDPFFAYMRSLCRLRPRGKRETDILEELSRVLVRSLLLALMGASPLPASTYSEAVQMLESDFANPGLTVDLIASRLGTSVRTLQAAFEAEGQTVSARLREVRARAALASRAANPRATASEIARLSGFGAKSTMYRAIRSLTAESEAERDAGRATPTEGGDAAGG